MWVASCDRKTASPATHYSIVFLFFLFIFIVYLHSVANRINFFHFLLVSDHRNFHSAGPTVWTDLLAIGRSAPFDASTFAASIIPRLHDEAGSTSWLDICSTFARCLLDVCLIV